MEYLAKFGILACLIVAAWGRAVFENECNCEQRFLQHYASKGCEVSQTDSCGCPTSYVCPSKNESSVPITGCIYRSIEYQVGSRIQLEDKCQMCRCTHAGDPHIVCRYRGCPQLEYVEGDNCHPVFEKNKCCPSRYECVIENIDNEVERTAALTCTYENVTYPFGAKMYSAEDPCQFCFCDENWNSFGNSTCRVQECVFERSQHYMDRGCIPVYHESKCCPIEYYCPEGRGIVEVTRENGTQNEEDVNDNGPHSCVFAGTSYAVGDILPTADPCVRCDCRVPPDATCVHQSCPPSPSPEHCYEFFAADQCCPVYDCVQADDAGEDNNTVDCPTPMCSDESCVIGVLDGHKCPTCICDVSREKNELEPSEDPVESQYIEVEEGPKQKMDVPKSIKTAQKQNPERFSEVPIENPDGEKESAENYREIFSETFVEEVRSKEKNAIQTILNIETAEREEKSVFQNLEDEGENIRNIQENNSTNEDELEVRRLPNEIRRKRSNYQYNHPHGSHYQYQQQQQQWLQQRSRSVDASSERELESSRENGQDYSEVKVFSSRETRTSEDMLTLEEEDYNNVIWRSTVPGCPTPMCADSTCRIGVPPGGSCPTCICKKRRQP